MDKIEVNISLCILYKGIPNGPALITYNSSDIEYYSFVGVGTFTNGKLHMGPFTAIDGFGFTFSFD
jgi:hypothetical protein